MGPQINWRYCQNCHMMFYDGNPEKGVCAPGIVGGHLAQGFNFNLSYDVPERPTAQTAWRSCSKCGVMFYDGYPDKGQCWAGGAHEAQGYNFTLPHDVAETANAQAAWRYCQLCHAMFFDGYADKGLCAAKKVFAPPRGFRCTGGHEAAGFDFVLPHDLQATPPPPPPGSLQVSLTGPVWVLSLNHQQSEYIQAIVAGGGGGLILALAVAPPVAAVIDAGLAAAVGIIKFMDAVGGDQGVDVQGVLGVAGVVVTPHGSGMLANLIAGAREGVAAATIVEFILKTGSQLPAVANSLGIQVAATVFSEVLSGTPLGWALAGAAGAIINLLQPAPDPNQHGGIHADRPAVQGDWERFILSGIGPGNQIALLSWQGLFSAQGAGGADVYANRPQLGPWETWTLIDNNDGTASFLANDGHHYLTALNGGGNGSYCLANAPAIGNWERFYIEDQPDGHIAVKTHDKGTYLSVQSGK